MTASLCLLTGIALTGTFVSLVHHNDLHMTCALLPCSFVALAVVRCFAGTSRSVHAVLLAVSLGVTFAFLAIFPDQFHPPRIKPNSAVSFFFVVHLLCAAILACLFAWTLLWIFPRDFRLKSWFSIAYAGKVTCTILLVISSIGFVFSLCFFTGPDAVIVCLMFDIFITSILIWVFAERGDRPSLLVLVAIFGNFCLQNCENWKTWSSEPRYDFIVSGAYSSIIICLYPRYVLDEKLESISPDNAFPNAICQTIFILTFVGMRMYLSYVYTKLISWEFVASLLVLTFCYIINISRLSPLTKVNVVGATCIAYVITGLCTFGLQNGTVVDTALGFLFISLPHRAQSLNALLPT